MIKGFRIVIIGLLLVLLLGTVAFAPACAKQAPTPAPKPAAPKQTTAQFPPLAGVKMPKTFVVLGGTTAGTGVDLMCECVAQIIHDAFPEMAVRHWPSAGLETLVKVDRKDGETGGATPASVFGAFQGIGVEKPTTNLRFLFNTPKDIYIVIVTLKNRDDIKTVADLGNKRIGTAEKGSMSAEMTEKAILRSVGLSAESIKANGGLLYFGPGAKLFEMLASGELDAVVITPSNPYGPITSLHVERGIKFVEMSDDTIKAIDTGFPGMEKGTIPAEIYKGIPAYKTSGIGYAMIAHKDVPDDIIYNITAACFLQPERWWHFIPTQKGQDFLAVATKNVVLAMHPGAEKYFKARGMNIEYSPIALGLSK